jgi:hypothetical protein
MKKNSSFLLFLGLMIIHGCAMQIGSMDPAPKLNLTKTNSTLYLDISNHIKNAFKIPEYSGVKNSEVKDWHTSLRKGFENGFKNFYTISQNKDHADLIIRLNQTDVQFTPISVSGYQNSTTLKAEIGFEALLLNQNDKVLKKITDIATAQKTINVKGQETEAVKNAIEIMYQKIAGEFFE